MNFFSIRIYSDDENKLQAELNKYITTCLQISSFKANFTQNYYNAITRERSSIKGTIFFKSPNLLLMKYDKPSKNFFLFDGSFFYFYNDEDNQVVKINPSEDKIQWIELITNCNFTSLFQIKDYKNNLDNISLVLKPSNKNEDITSINAIIDKKNYILSNITIIEPVGNQNSFSFYDISLNCKIDNNIFKFIKPEKAEIVYME
jgi:chaperone LolA